MVTDSGGSLAIPLVARLPAKGLLLPEVLDMGMVPAQELACLPFSAVNCGEARVSGGRSPLCVAACWKWEIPRRLAGTLHMLQQDAGGCRRSLRHAAAPSCAIATTQQKLATPHWE